MVAYQYSWFWNERFWLPPNVTWADLRNTDEVQYPQTTQLYVSTKYDPVCAPSGVEFFSPCIAGCMEQLPGESKLQSYGMCSCLPTNQSAASGSPDVENKVTSGHCPNNCDLLPVVLCALFVYAVGMASMGPAMLFSTLRCVQESRRSLALGFQSLIARFLGAIPGPIVYGSLIDRACLLWNETCDQKGACLVYDNANLSTYFFTVTFALACWIFLSLCLALYSWKRSEANSKLIDEKNAELDNDARKRVSGILELVYYRETTV
ncbi:solute carrier organic anion transporter family member 4A1-like [Branchiostoma floridae]|uniref:Solute carrier organic anion transporter family member 4A1-like n=1 Tax=Branchiostoma floridae TaxID=7739 RepID=A0A9J7LX04_BRAFL|nr:solute carrier organic anion transporter family member 4A1-like [Branchiostoma floridae]